MRRTTSMILLVALAGALSAQAPISAADKERSDRLYPQLMKDITPYRDSLESWAVEFNSERWYTQNRIMPTTAEEFMKLLADLAAIEKIITSEKYAGILGYWGPEEKIVQWPQYWLEICQARVATSQRVLKRELSRILRPQILHYQLMTDSVRDFDGWGLDENGLAIVMGKREPARKAATVKVAGLFKAVQLDPATARVDEFETACDALVKMAESMAAKAKPAATYSMSSVSAGVKSRWASGAWKSRQITKINTEASTWKVTTNAVGTPLYRTVAVVVQFKLPGYAYLIEYSTQVKENYIGGGKFQFVTSNISPDYRIVKPK